jgi:hypothetical protein
VGYANRGQRRLQGAGGVDRSKRPSAQAGHDEEKAYAAGWSHAVSITAAPNPGCNTIYALPDRFTNR